MGNKISSILESITNALYAVVACNKVLDDYKGFIHYYDNLPLLERAETYKEAWISLMTRLYLILDNKMI